MARSRSELAPWASAWLRAGWVYVDGGRDFQGRRGDCWALVMAISRELGNACPDAAGYNSSDDTESVQATAQPLKAPAWCSPVQPGNERPGDVIMIAAQHGLPTHAGIVAGGGWFLNLRGSGVRCERYARGVWETKAREFWRLHPLP